MYLTVTITSTLRLYITITLKYVIITIIYYYYPMSAGDETREMLDQFVELIILLFFFTSN